MKDIKKHHLNCAERFEVVNAIFQSCVNKGNCDTRIILEIEEAFFKLAAAA